jgi:hypothetical protein
MYCHAFYKTLVLVQGKSLKDFKTKYDPVLGAVYPEDIIAIKKEKSAIESVVDLKGSLVRMGYLDLRVGNEEVHQLCIRAMEAREGYSKTDPLVIGLKSTTSSVRSRPRRGGRISKYANTDGSNRNRYAVLAEESSNVVVKRVVLIF